MNLLKKIFRRRIEELNISTVETIEEFRERSIGYRLKQIVLYGDTGKQEYYPLLKYAILEDPDLHVKWQR